MLSLQDCGRGGAVRRCLGVTFNHTEVRQVTAHRFHLTVQLLGAAAPHGTPILSLLAGWSCHPHPLCATNLPQFSTWCARTKV